MCRHKRQVQMNNKIEQKLREFTPKRWCECRRQATDDGSSMGKQHDRKAGMRRQRPKPEVRGRAVSRKAGPLPCHALARGPACLHVPQSHSAVEGRRQDLHGAGAVEGRDTTYLRSEPRMRRWQGALRALRAPHRSRNSTKTQPGRDPTEPHIGWAAWQPGGTRVWRFLRLVGLRRSSQCMRSLQTLGSRQPHNSWGHHNPWDRRGQCDRQAMGSALPMGSRQPVGSPQSVRYGAATTHDTAATRRNPWGSKEPMVPPKPMGLRAAVAPGESGQSALLLVWRQ